MGKEMDIDISDPESGRLLRPLRFGDEDEDPTLGNPEFADENNALENMFDELEEEEKKIVKEVRTDVRELEISFV